MSDLIGSLLKAPKKPKAPKQPKNANVIKMAPKVKLEKPKQPKNWKLNQLTNLINKNKLVIELLTESNKSKDELLADNKRLLNDNLELLKQFSDKEKVVI